jgi:integrase
MTNLVSTENEQAYLELHAIIEMIVASVGEKSQRVYRQSAGAFANWLLMHSLIPAQLTKVHMTAYHASLAHYAPATAQRLWSIANRVLDEYVDQGLLPKNPSGNLKGFKVADETTHLILSKEEAERLLDSIDQSTPIGIRDYTILYLLVRLGLRRSECAGLDRADLTAQQGQPVLIVRKGKGRKRRVNKLSADVKAVLARYLELYNDPISPALFPAMTKAGRFRAERLTDSGIYKLVKKYAKAAGIPHLKALSPHGLRATSITLKLQAKAPLDKVQEDHGHADPRTTMRYKKRADMLEKSSAEYEDWI